MSKSINQSIEPSNWQRISNLAKLRVQKSAKIKNLICLTLRHNQYENRIAYWTKMNLEHKQR
jgi:hypothetical protein